MSSTAPIGLRVLGLWLLYAVVGFIILLAIDSGPDLSSDRSTPTRFSTKLVAGLSGVLFGVGGLGAYVLSTPDGRSEPGIALAAGGFGLGAVLVVVGMTMIYRDLEKRGRR